MRLVTWAGIAIFAILIVGGALFLFYPGEASKSTVVLDDRSNTRSTKIESVGTTAPKKSPVKKITTEAISDQQSISGGKRDEGASWNILIVLLILVVAALVLSVCTNVLLFKWRRNVGESQVSIVPSELENVLNKLTNSHLKVRDRFSDLIKFLGKREDDTEKQISELMEAFSVLQNALSDKDREIQRLKKGYDSEVFRRFLIRFIRVDNALADEIDAAENDSSINVQRITGVRDLLRDALEDSGVSEFSPSIGESVREGFGIADNYKTVPAESSEQELTVAEVLEPGFLIRTPEGKECIKQARVTVFASALEEGN